MRVTNRKLKYIPCTYLIHCSAAAEIGWAALISGQYFSTVPAASSIIRCSDTTQKSRDAAPIYDLIRSNILGSVRSPPRCPFCTLSALPQPMQPSTLTRSPPRSSWNSSRDPRNTPMGGYFNSAMTSSHIPAADLSFHAACNHTPTQTSPLWWSAPHLNDEDTRKSYNTCDLRLLLELLLSACNLETLLQTPQIHLRPVRSHVRPVCSHARPHADLSTRDSEYHDTTLQAHTQKLLTDVDDP